jgi:hypothetical protein
LFRDALAVIDDDQDGIITISEYEAWVTMSEEDINRGYANNFSDSWTTADQYNFPGELGDAVCRSLFFVGHTTIIEQPGETK